MKITLQNRAEQVLTFEAREPQIERVKSIADFGVSFSQNVSCDLHIENIVKKVSRI